jgi:NAD(P)H dehydrogenase (quinone)
VNVLVVHCHPVPESFVTAAYARVIVGLSRSGHDVRTIDLYADGFDPVFDADEHRRHLEPGVATPELAPYVEALRWCHTIVLVYPTWWSGQPAMLKGWFDRVWVRGVAWDLPEGSNRIRPLLRNVRRIVVVTTHGSSKFTNALEGEAGKRTVTRSLRLMCHPRCRTRWWAYYGIDTDDLDRRTAFLDKIEARAAVL